MKRRLMKLLFFVLVVAVLLFLVARGDGYILIAYGTKTTEMTLFIAALFAVILVLAIWFIRLVLQSSVGMARRFRELFMFGSVERAQKRAANGMVDFLVGDWFEARKKLVRTFDKVEYPLANYIAAAMSSFEMGDEAEAEKTLEHALKLAQSELPVALARARLHLKAGRYDKAVAILKPIDIKIPHQAAVLDLMHQIYIAQHNWRALEELFPAMRKAKVLSNIEFESLEALLACEKIKHEGHQVKSLLIAERLPALHKLWNGFSRKLQKKSEVITAYVQVLAENYQDQEAEIIARKALTANWHEPLVLLYGRLQVKEIHSQIRTVDTWLKLKPQDPALLLTMGRLMFVNQQWELAKEYFQRSLKLEKRLETSMELSKLMEKLGDHKRASEYSRLGLDIVIEDNLYNEPEKENRKTLLVKPV